MPPKKNAVEPVIEEVEKVEWKRLWPAAPSLKPSASVIEMAARGNEEACAIRDAWRFCHPVRVVSREEYEALVEKGTMTFHG